jgi:hypothetical protein
MQGYVHRIARHIPLQYANSSTRTAGFMVGGQLTFLMAVAWLQLQSWQRASKAGLTPCLESNRLDYEISGYYIDLLDL